jgi:uncharacterized protein YjbI with pentapeptide repeats
MNTNRPDQLTAQKGVLKFETSIFFDKLKESVASFFNNEYGGMTKSAFEALVQKDDSESALLYAVIWQAAGKACTKLIRDYCNVNNFKQLGSDAAVLRGDLARHLEDTEFTINIDFFRLPHKHPQIAVLRDVLKTWITEALGIDKENAERMAGAFPRYFLNALLEVDRDAVKKVRAYFDHPFLEAQQREHMLADYHADLLKQYQCSAFGNNLLVGLDDLYIEPNFCFFKPHIVDGVKENYIEPHHPKDVDKKNTNFCKFSTPLSMHAFFEEWRLNQLSDEIKNKNKNLMLLLGQPGQGKTSFCLRTVHSILSKSDTQPVYYVRLRDLEDNVNSLIETPLSYLKEKFSKRIFEPLKIEDDVLWHEALLILDGLDELYMNKNMNTEQINTFLRNLRVGIDELKKHRQSIDLKCMVTSRHHYVNLDKYEHDDWLILSLDNMQLTQQKEWLFKYRPFVKDDTKQYLDKLNDKLVELDKSNDKKSQELRSLVNQPILLTIIAQAEVDIDSNSDRAKIYRMMFDTFQKRSWADDQIPSLKELKTNDKIIKAYRHVLQRLAVHIFQSHEEYVRRSDFEEQGTPLHKAFDRLNRAYGDAPLSIELLLSSFHFKQVVKQYDTNKADEKHNYAFEFMHKSLQEYLVAEGMWAYMQKLGEKNEEDDYKISKEKVFEELFTEWFSPRFLTYEVVEYLQELIQDTDNNKQQIQVLKIRIKNELLPYFCQHQFLYTYKSKDKSKPPLEQSIAMFYGFWTVASLVAIVDMPYQLELLETESQKYKDKINYANIINISNKLLITDFIFLLRRLYRTAQLALNYQDLSYVNFSGADLGFANFSGADLSRADLSRADLNGASFHKANLSEANLHGASINEAGFFNANLFKADLFRAELFGADLIEADLREAILIEADLHGAGLFRADLRGADLCEVCLNNADLSDADLSDAVLSAADLRGANLHGTNLRGANLHGTDLRGAIFFDENGEKGVKYLDKAYNLDEADFRDTIFEGKIHKRVNGSFWIEGYSKKPF